MHYWLSVPVCMLFDVLLFGCVYDYIVCVVVGASRCIVYVVLGVVCSCVARRFVVIVRLCLW